MPRLSRKPGSASPKHLVVAGNGIASLRFCEEAIACGLTRKFKITILGGEKLPAYDRVRLSQYVKARSADPLLFHSESWYRDNGIALFTGDPVAAIYPEAHKIVTGSGREHFYDELVLATGSSAFVPPIPGTDLPGVFVYRTVDDLDAIIRFASGKKSAAVIGGGLLGLEAAQALDELGLETTILERSAFPMPRQLNAAAGKLVSEKIRKLGLELRTGFSTREISRAGGQLRMTGQNGVELTTDLIVISTGILPNSAIAAEAGLACGVRGGVIVDDQLRTSDPHIHAVGECALHRGEIYGLAAPATAMARHVARSLAGKKPRPFEKPDLSTRLKMLGIDVVTIGDPLDRGTTLEFTTDDSYRLITLDAKQRPVGALGIGDWPESSLIHGWHLEGRAMRQKEIEGFTNTGTIDVAAASASAVSWPAERLVCNCMRVTKGNLCHAMAAGAACPADLAAATGASTVCGSCLPLLEELCGAPVSARRSLSPTLLIVAAVAALIAIAAVFLVRIPTATSVESFTYRLDRFWSDTQPKQITGYSLLGVSLLGLAISLRKRIPRFRFGTFARWRLFHAAFGLVSLGVLFAHTGFRFGSNLNASLMGVFVGLNLLGALAGIAAGLESRGGPRSATFARRVRPGLTVAHYILFWPLPVLLGFHIASAYLY
ncbi:FAD-dependent oxidoreductase [Luteolibacter marinus]|uniref:FAD-dependent oxidoreductase n=1 Tax=Luteolibacter marinus TaxID=2776705 RepID=UPI001866E0F2|nr:FAD-dependent oxidoreductase [Luteolibacter marinus]